MRGLFFLLTSGRPHTSAPTCAPCALPSIHLVPLRRTSPQEVATPLRDGWGVTSDGANLIVSDSSEVLTWVDPVTMLKVRDVTVTGE